MDKFELHSSITKQLMEAEQQERIEMRRKRIRRNRTICWCIFATIILIMAAGIGAGVGKLTKAWPDKGQTIIDNTGEPEVSTDNPNSAISDMFENESSISVSTEPEVKEPTEEELFEAALSEYIKAMPLKDKVAGLFVVTLEELTKVNKVTKAGTVTKEALDNYSVGGIIFTANNIVKADQFAEMVTNIKGYSKYPLFLTVDEEPGNTVMASKLKLEKTKSAAAIGDTMDPGVAYDENKKICDYLNQYGINLNLGIMAEILPSEPVKFMGDRGYGQDPTIVGQMVSQSVAVYEDNGINVAVKFFPGQSYGNQDTMTGISTTHRTKDEFMASEIPCYEKAVASGADVLLISHVSAPELTGDELSCSRSKYLMSELIRNEMGLTDIIIMTDSMEKAAVSDYYEAGEASIASLKAGADMILMPADFEEAYNSVYEAVIKGVIAEQRITDSLTRVYRVKFKGMSSEEILQLMDGEKVAE